MKVLIDETNLQTKKISGGILLNDKPNIPEVFILLSVIFLLSNMSCWKNEGIDIIKELKAAPGNECALLQWEFLEMAGDVGEICIYRSDGDSLHWDDIAFQDTVYYYAMSIGRFLDKTVQNGRKYYYRVQPPGHAEIGYKYSNIVVVTPNSALPSNLIPPPCTNIIVTPSGDSAIVTWTPPQGNDGLYYFADHSDSLAVPDDWVSNWEPETLSTPRYVLKPFRAGNSFRILIVVGGILSETSKPILLTRTQ